jgi:hypothetical protein
MFTDFTIFNTKVLKIGCFGFSRKSRKYKKNWLDVNIDIETPRFG